MTMASVRPPHALRRAPEIILVGESRDLAWNPLSASPDGDPAHASSGHEPGVIRMLTGMTQGVSEDHRCARVEDLIASLRTIVAQRLMRPDEAKQEALREILDMAPQIREELLSADLDQWPAVIRRHVGFLEETC